MLGILLVFLAPFILVLILALLLPRAGALLAWIVGLLPAAWLAVESSETLANPLTLFFIASVMALPALAGAFGGLALARLLGRSRSRRSAR